MEKQVEKRIGSNWVLDTTNRTNKGNSYRLKKVMVHRILYRLHSHSDPTRIRIERIKSIVAINQLAWIADIESAMHLVATQILAHLTLLHILLQLAQCLVGKRVQIDLNFLPLPMQRPRGLDDVQDLL